MKDILIKLEGLNKQGERGCGEVEALLLWSSTYETFMEE